MITLSQVRRSTKLSLDGVENRTYLKVETCKSTLKYETF